MIELEDVIIDLSGFCLGSIDLFVDESEFFILLGPTGAGKSLVLEAIAGIRPLTRGCIKINAKDVTRLPPEKRNVGIVYQDYSLFPHLTVMQNIEYGLRYRKEKDRLSRERITELMESTGIKHLAKRSVTTLSGGEKQRVALVRALSMKPSVLLLDEPLSALDRLIRDEIRKLLKDLHGQTGTTFMMVTHDFTEALFLGSKAGVLNNGKLEQGGTIQKIFRSPKNVFVANFVGISNVFPAEFENGFALSGGVRLKLKHRPRAAAGHIAIRPEDIRICRLSQKDCLQQTCLAGHIVDFADCGLYGEVSVKISSLVFKVVLSRFQAMELLQDTDCKVLLEIPPEAVLILE